MRTKTILAGRVTNPMSEREEQQQNGDEFVDVENVDSKDTSMPIEKADDEFAESPGWIIPSHKRYAFPRVCCQFRDCEAIFDGHYKFRVHFIETHFPADGQGLEGQCGVVGCHFSYDDLDAYRRHLTFHIYHVVLEYRGAEVLAKTNSQCRHNLDDANNVFYNGDALQCSWNDCGETFDDVAQFFLHVSLHGKELNEQHRSEKEQKFLCLWTNCNYGTKRKYEITGHLRHHSGEKVVACPTCGAFFANSTKLTDHCTRQLATESSRLKCMLCNKVFSSERLLRDHGRRHINNYKCPFCEMSLPTPSTLRWHVMHRHSEAAPHVCLTCSKAFKSPLDLERHFTKHSDSADHECRVCGKKFKWLQSMHTHERKHYQVETAPYLCHLCPKKYRQGVYLSQHFAKVHNVSLPPGHSRFTYKKCADGYFRVITERYESARLNEQEQSSA